MVSFLQFFIFLFFSTLLGTVVGFPKSQHQKINNVASRNALSHRAGRYLFPFAVINFPPEPCAPTRSPQMEGVCVSRQRCNILGGESVGACQQGFGTCCKFVRQCPVNKRSVIVTEAVENLMNSNTAGSCEFVFPKQPGICQVRLDFTIMMLQQPHTNGANAGNCQAESVTVVGAANLNGPLKVCGRLSGQHMILSYGTTSEQISVIVHSEMISQNYNIRATQIPCHSINKAPDDCLQYFTSTTAAIKSFGFPNQLNNQKYTICVKPHSGGSAFTWDRCMDMDSDGVRYADRFNISEQTTLTAPCLTDWILIESEKRCGTEFLPLMTNSGSYAKIRVNFDENETGNDIFNVTFNKPIIESYCASVMNDQSVFQEPGPRMNFCKFNTNVCECKFSNMRNKFAQPLKIQIPDAMSDGTYKCPNIQGYTASPQILPVGTTDCLYYANIRIADINNTGFCLRYQAM